VPWAVAAALALVLAVTGAGWWRATRPVDRPLTRFSVDLGPDALRGINLTAAISPDGRRLVFPGRGPDGKPLLATRLLDQALSTLLPGTENGSDPFFSPDSQSIAFFSGPILKKMSAAGSAPETLAVGHTLSPGGNWGRDGNIVVSISQLDSIFRLPSTGGVPQRITRLGEGESTHRWPQVLPGGAGVLYTASNSANQMDGAAIAVASFKSGKSKVLVRGGYYGRYLPTGHLVYIRHGVLNGVRFDPDSLEIRGAPLPLIEDVAANPVTGGGQFDFSETGTLVYAPGAGVAQAWKLDWLDSSGKSEPLISTPGPYALPRFSPDGRKVALLGKGADLYVYLIDRHALVQLTFTGGPVLSPVWAPDNQHLVYGSSAGLTWIRSDGVGEPQTVLENHEIARPFSFSPDGRRLAYAERNMTTGLDIWTLPLDLTDPDHPKAGKPEPYLRTPAEELVPAFSPDGHWIAYRAIENGAPEIYVRPFPDAGGGKWRISTGGGLYAMWSRNGHELFYETTDNRIMVVDYTAEGASFLVLRARLWSDKQLFYTGTMNLDLAPDGKRFLVFTLPEASPGDKGSVHVTVLENFFDWLRKKLP
jgi:serine/threonine-protein kinase